ncbi:MAG: 3-dehydroquinate synthase [Oscillospiraceae bacterium]|nr:3-dehydroquinate synthase [Oscillospiraceae bacterium]
MSTIHIAAGRPYDVLIEAGLLKQCGQLIREVHAPCSVAVVTDDGVPTHLADTAEASLKQAGFAVQRIVFRQGEAHKNLETLSDLLEFFASIPLTRGDLVVALGGGIVGDTAGFAASSYLRGIPFVQVPTTLLAAVDSSVGGKTAVNLQAGKNLTGAFWQPSLVICDTDILAVLNDDLMADGAAECVKYGVLGDAELFAMLEQGGLRSSMKEIVTRCVEMKGRIVAEDEHDTGSRQLLNLGHTLGHAIERAGNFALTHGHGVAIGMVLITRAAIARGLCEASALPRLTNALKACGLPVECPYKREQLLEAALRDKKRQGGSITLVVPKAIGSTVLMPVPVEELSAWIDDGLNA